jgi:gluconolactonase
MRIPFSLVILSVALLGACSSDSDATGATGSLAPSPSSSAGGPGSEPPADESNSSDPSEAAPSPGDEPSSGSEAVDVRGPLDTGDNESESGSGPSSNAGAGATPPTADAGAPRAPSAICPPGPFPADPLAGAGAPQAVCTGLTFTEGAVWFAEQNTLFFSDILFNDPGAGRILSFTPGGACQPFIENAGTNGLVIAPDGNLLGARHSDRTLTLFDLETLAPTVFVADNAGVPFVSPNDIAVRSDGNIYFTDPDYGLGGAQAAQPTRAYHRDPDGTLTAFDEQGNSNGVTLSPDESLLYLSHLGGTPPVNDVLVFDLDATGAPVNPRPFITGGGSDGMGIDCAGNLYITQNGAVLVFAPDGTQIGSIAAPQAANIAFGGPERRTLFITAGPDLLAAELAIPGLPY